jgi:hypothetical protein
VWDREIIQTALAEFYDKDMGTFRKQLEHNLTKVSEDDPVLTKELFQAKKQNYISRCVLQGTWSDDVTSWGDCEDLLSCPTKLVF